MGASIWYKPQEMLLCMQERMCVNVWERETQLRPSPPSRGHVSRQVKGAFIWWGALTFRVGSSPVAELRQTRSFCCMTASQVLCAFVVLCLQCPSSTCSEEILPNAVEQMTQTDQLFGHVSSHGLQQNNSYQHLHSLDASLKTRKIFLKNYFCCLHDFLSSKHFSWLNSNWAALVRGYPVFLLWTACYWEAADIIIISCNI